MMKSLFIILLSFAGFVSFAQNPVISVTAPEGVDFQFYVGNKEYSEGPDNACEIETLPAGKYRFTITFDNDTVADVVKDYTIKKGRTYTFTIKEKSKLVKGVRKAGRKIKNNDYNDDKLVDFYGVEIKWTDKK